MSVTAPAVAGAETGFSPRRWFGDIVAELKKVTWPSRREVVNLTTVVVVISLLLGMVMGGADLLFGWVVEQTLLR
ncbi:MAG: preprotein translocase subunit SecE [Dehalococcoidia bacterium]|nr:MAG: preprotein translocase subunit SecE [Dehalococcoidia bacterium]